MEDNKKRTHMSRHGSNGNKKLKVDSKYNNNAKMHPNNIYKDSPPNFSMLASKYESFRPLYSSFPHFPIQLFQE